MILIQPKDNTLEGKFCVDTFSRAVSRMERGTLRTLKVQTRDLERVILDVIDNLV